MKTFEQEQTPINLPRGSNILVVHAHPDDESMGGGLLDAANRSDVTPHVFYATNGEASTYGDAEILRTRGRRQEALRALGHYSVLEQYVHFEELPDGRLLDDHMAPLEDAISRTLRAAPFSAIVTLGTIGYDGHSDHIATHIASLAAASQYMRDGNDIRLFGLTRGQGTHFIPADQAKKLGALAEHVTQFEISRSPDALPNSSVIGETGYWLSDDTRRRLEPYQLNHQLEVYKEFDLLNVGELALIGATEVSA
jgi:LmbE family N-acetylglucosaminyl deacetylase